ncbi:toxin-activating lysine-acyltransferase [Thalassobius sp. Cn5-15]|uniref:toxin-activating lysine-acyltransferase n=1 Tax=Thalassobius sp. Cn5-15 TaxID=2917763 RepID=UPI001EF2BE66|nr:toxin-activating lysine-acyltransferase [Thalassobius sp. Cn5-15]MCG7495092.1 toxin-activating lysine-acyltransferase [Thalassobius sp. Cn5-15]
MCTFQGLIEDQIGRAPTEFDGLRWVGFEDYSDPKSVFVVDPADLAASYGEGYALTRLTLQITDDPLTQGEVEKVLGWLRGYEEWLRVVFSDGRDLDGLGEVGKKVGAEPFSTFLCPQGQKPTASTPCPMTSQATLPLPRYRHQTLADLQHLVLDPLIRDRLAIWASVSEEVDAKIRNGVWPLRLKAEDWASGEISWLIDVIAPDRKTTASVLGNFKQVVKGGDLRLHPIIGRLVDKETLEKMGASQGEAPDVTKRRMRDGC